MRYLSVCSGIESATAAWHTLGWQPVAFSEIEPFPCALLAHHYPDTPNWGDMTKFKEWPDANVDLLVGGTPCQSFSVAGLRKGLDDPRGNLMLTYLATAGRYRPKWVVWENVPGVLSSNEGKDFGAFLGGLAELGYGFAYRVLDAQYFGVAQRRRRVFVVGCLGDWRAAAAVLFERDSLSGNPAPSREAGQVVAGTLASRTEGGGFPGTDEARSGYVQPVAGTLCADAHPGSYTGQDAYSDRLIPHVTPTLVSNGDAHSGFRDEQGLVTCLTGQVTHTLTAEGFDASEDGSGRGTPIVAYPLLEIGKRTGISTTDKRAGAGIGKDTDPMFTLQAGAQHGVALSVALRGRDGGATAELGDEIAGCLRGSSGGGDKPHVLASVSVREISQTLTSNYGKQVDSSDTALGPNVVYPNMQVRRLTPVECERLQGFPDEYTNIKFKGKPVGDGHRYKALGNSKAVPVVRWIGKRIEAVNALS